MKKIIYTIAFLPIIGTQISCTKEKIVEVEKKVEVEKIVEVEVEKQSESPEDIQLFNSILRLTFDGNLTYNTKGNFTFAESLAYGAAEININRYNSQQIDYVINRPSLFNFKLNDDIDFEFTNQSLIIQSQKPIEYITANSENPIRQGKKFEIKYRGGFDKQRRQSPNQKYLTKTYQIFQYIKENQTIKGANLL